MKKLQTTIHQLFTIYLEHKSLEARLETRNMIMDTLFNDNVLIFRTHKHRKFVSDFNSYDVESLVLTNILDKKISVLMKIKDLDTKVKVDVNIKRFLDSIESTGSLYLYNFEEKVNKVKLNF